MWGRRNIFWCGAGDMRGDWWSACVPTQRNDHRRRPLQRWSSAQASRWSECARVALSNSTPSPASLASFIFIGASARFICFDRVTSQSLISHKYSSWTAKKMDWWKSWESFRRSLIAFQLFEVCIFSRISTMTSSVVDVRFRQVRTDVNTSKVQLTKMITLILATITNNRIATQRCAEAKLRCVSCNLAFEVSTSATPMKPASSDTRRNNNAHCADSVTGHLLLTSKTPPALNNPKSHFPSPFICRQKMSKRGDIFAED